MDFHEDEFEAVAGELTAGGKAAFLEAFLRPAIPGQRLQVNSVQRGTGKNIVEHGAHGIGAIPRVPVRFVANHDADFSLAANLVDIEIAAVTDVFPFERVDSKMTGAVARV